MTVDFLPVQPNTPFPLGRSVINHDPLNRGFAALERSTLEPQAHAGYGWMRRDVYDQIGPSCTTGAAVGLLRTSPFRRALEAKRSWPALDTEQERFDFYVRSKGYDPYPGTDYDGTSSDAPHRLMVELGVTPGYHWLFGEPQLWEWVTWFGPASGGTVWKRDMFYPDAKGFLSVTGVDDGGHEYDLIKAHQEGQFYVVCNTWSRAWGRNGRAYIRRPDMDRLLKQQGDAITIGV